MGRETYKTYGTSDHCAAVVDGPAAMVVEIIVKQAGIPYGKGWLAVEPAFETCGLHNHGSVI